jgi:hypothetical protein
LIERRGKSARELRDFGLLTGALFASLFGLGLPYLKGHAVPVWPWLLAVVLWGLALTHPSSLKYPFLAWERFGLILGWVNSRVILGLIFVLLIVPIGVLARLLGHDPTSREFDPEATSYRIPSSRTSAESLDRPF